VLEELRRVAATKSDAPLFDAAFVNLYRSGDDFVGPHRDNVHGLEHPILSFSFYEEPYSEDDLRTLQIFEGERQEKFKHAVPAKPESRRARINVTFRITSRPEAPTHKIRDRSYG